MKLRFYHHLMMALVALVMLFVGCKKEETIDFEVPSDSILIEIGGYGREGTTTFTSDMFLPFTSRAFNKPAAEMMAVPC